MSWITTRLASGFQFTEGPVWHPDGFLLFSDIHGSRVYRWSASDGVTPHLDIAGMHPNGLALEQDGSLIVCEHGRRRVSRCFPDGSIETLVSHFEGKRLNSPNDVVVKSDGAIYFTDPPYGLAMRDADPAKELSFNGVFRLQQGELMLLNDTMSKPNGLAFSRDEKHLYVANSDPEDRHWNRFEVLEGGALSAGERFFTPHNEDPGVPDGMKVAPDGTLFCTGPGGILVLSPSGELIETIRLPEIPANLAWGPEGQLFVTARSSIYSVTRR